MERVTRIRRERAEHECVKAGVANRTWPILDKEGDGEAQYTPRIGFGVIWDFISSSSSSRDGEARD